MKAINTLWGNILKKKPVLEAIREIPLFSELSARDLSVVEKFLHPRTYNKDEVIFFEGDPGVGMYIVIEGNVDITKSSGNGKKINLATIEEGGFFGEISIIEGGPRTATATAVDKAELLGFFKADLDELIERRPEIAAKTLFQIARILGERLRVSNDKLSRLSGSASLAAEE